jgi:hypothetical protein
MNINFDRLLTPTAIAKIGPEPIRKLVAAIDPSLRIPAAGKNDAVADLAKWLRALPPEDHTALFEHIHAILHVLDQEDLQQILIGRQISVPTGPLGAVVADLAIKAPDTLFALSAQASVSEAHSAKTFVTYRRPDTASYDAKPTRAKIEMVEKLCQSALETSGHGRYCRVWDSADGPNVALVIAYGAGLRSRRMISRADAAELQTNRTPRDAVVLITPGCREIRVSAGTGRERDLFVSAAEAAFCSPKTKFKCTEVYNLEVIGTQSFAKKLARLQGETFSKAALAELVLIRRDELATRIVLRARDVLELVREEGLDLGQYEPKRAVLEFSPAEGRGRRRWRIDLKAGARKCTAPWSQEMLDAILDELGLHHKPR